MKTSADLLAEYKRIQRKLARLEYWLRRSYEQCVALDFGNLTEADNDNIEDFTARFQRALEVFVGSYLRILDRVEARSGSLRDVLDRAEKHGLIDSAEEFWNLKIMRNEMAHEYPDYDPVELAKPALLGTPPLLEALRKAQALEV